MIMLSLNIQSKLIAIANAVTRIDNLEFLFDVVPKTVTYREFKQQKAARQARKQEMLQNGQTTLDASKTAPKRPDRASEVEDGPRDDQGHPLETQVNGHTSRRGSQLASPQTNGNNSIVFRHYQPNGAAPPQEPQDAEMS